MQRNYVRCVSSHGTVLPGGDVTCSSIVVSQDAVESQSKRTSCSRKWDNTTHSTKQSDEH